MLTVRAPRSAESAPRRSGSTVSYTLPPPRRSRMAATTHMSLPLPSLAGAGTNHTNLRVTNEKYSRDRDFISMLASAKNKDAAKNQDAAMRSSATAGSLAGGPSSVSLRSSASTSFRIAEGLGPKHPVKPSRRRQLDPLQKETADEEMIVKRRVFKLRNELGRSRSMEATMQVSAQNQIMAKQVRDETRRMQGEHLHGSVKYVTPATDEEVGKVATLLMRTHATVEPDVGNRSWYKIFKAADANGDGHIMYSELEYMIRFICKVPKDKLSDTTILAVWNSIDLDGNGWIDAGEFGRFFRLGEKPMKESRRLSQERRSIRPEKEFREPTLAEIRVEEALKNKLHLESEEKQLELALKRSSASLPALRRNSRSSLPPLR